MPNEHEIKSEKILVKDVFSKMWFRIPEYQRPYIWSKDEVNELLDDLTFAQKEKPNQEYFLGSFVFQAKKADPAHGQDFDENDLLDGQQRMTTLLMLFACIRDLSDSDKVRPSCQKSIFQKGDEIDDIPERTRIAFAIRQAVQDFVDEFVKMDGGTKRETDLEKSANTSNDPSIPNMARAILEMRRYLMDPYKQISLIDFVKFLRTRVLLIYVATEDLDDAFRLFTILNDRGVPLRSSDILKSLNLGALERVRDKTHYAKLWEEAEGELGDEFDRFLNYLRTILVKEKARLNLRQEFADKIYDPKEKDKATGKPKPALLKKGKETFQLVERYLKHYNVLFGGSNHNETGGNFRFDNLLRVMLAGLPSTDWIPPLLCYFDKFKYDCLLEFLTQLDNKFSADWIPQYAPTDRIDNMNQVIKVVESTADSKDVLTDPCFKIDADAFTHAVDASVYGRRFTRYLLIKLDWLYQDHAQQMTFKSLSAEHVLPQTPADDSQWKKDFTDEQRKKWTDRLGNLVLISTAKNSSQGRLDYTNKKSKYFANKINTYPNSLRVLQNTKWTPTELESNHHAVLATISEHYRIPSSKSTP
jgi:uncharacterized protein with ParB-like and HNH nuclease domain